MVFVLLIFFLKGEAAEWASVKSQFCGLYEIVSRERERQREIAGVIFWRNFGSCLMVGGSVISNIVIGII